MPAREYEVASVNQLADGKIRQVNVEGTAVLLVPDGDAIYAVAATCPHAERTAGGRESGMGEG